MNVDYGKIVTNALSTLVAAVFVGAAVIVWNAATSVDERIEVAKEDILKQQARLQATQETLGPRVTGMESSIEDLRAEIRSLSKLLADAKALPAGASYKAGEPIILDEFKPGRTADWKVKEFDRLSEEIDVRQNAIYQGALER